MKKYFLCLVICLLLYSIPSTAVNFHEDNYDHLEIYPGTIKGLIISDCSPYTSYSLYVGSNGLNPYWENFTTGSDVIEKTIYLKIDESMFNTTANNSQELFIDLYENNLYIDRIVWSNPYTYHSPWVLDWWLLLTIALLLPIIFIILVKQFIKLI